MQMMAERLATILDFMAFMSFPIPICNTELMLGFPLAPETLSLR